ncbi:MAG: Hint domain-containing protein [Pseudomonadota bacterium]
MAEKIVNGDFEAGLSGWTTTDGETHLQNVYFGDGSTTRTVEMDGNRNAITSYSQTFSVSADETGPNQTQTLTMDIGDRNAAAGQVNGMRVELRDPNGDMVDLTGTGGAVFTDHPDGGLLVDAQTTGQMQTVSITFTFDIPGDYTISLIEDNTGDARGNDSLSIVVDNVSLDAVCYAAGTLIATAFGDLPVEKVRPGFLVQTLDNGLQPVRWVGQRKLSATELSENPHLWPIRIAAGALGQNMPARDLILSPQHRVLVCSSIAERVFGSREVLLPAKKLVGMPGITVEQRPENVTYVHLLCDRHEIVLAEGAPGETFYLGRQALKTLDTAARAEIETLFPDLANAETPPLPARPIARGKRVAKLVMRHRKNRQPLLPADLSSKRLELAAAG